MRDDQKTKAELGSGAGGKKPIKEAEKLRARKAKLERVSSELTKHKNSDEELYKAKADWEKTFDAISDWIALIDLKGRILRTNRSGEDFTGISSAQIVGQSCCKLVHGSEEYIPGCPLQKMLHSRQRERTELKVPDTNRWLLVTVDPVTDKEGNLVGSVHIIRDITEHKRAEEALRKREELHELFFSQSLDGFFYMMFDEPIRWDDTVNKEKVLDYVFAHHRITKINDAMLQQYGASREQFIGLTPNDLYAHDIAYGRDVWRDFFDAGRLHLETDERKLDGTPIWIDGDYICLYDSQGRITGHFGVQREVTEEKRAREALRESEQKYRALVEQSLQGIIILQDLQIVFANPTAAKIAGLTVEEVLALSHEDIKAFIPAEERATVLQRFEDRLAGKPVQHNYELRLMRKNGDGFWLDVFISQIEYLGKSAIQVAFIDITERKQAEDKIRQIKESYDRLTDNADEAIFRVKAGGRYVTYLNTAAERIFGYSKAEWAEDPSLGSKIIHPDYKDKQKEIIKELNTTKKTIKNTVLKWIAKDGHEVIVEYTIVPIIDSSGKVIYFESIGRDITERKRAEEALRESQENYRMVSALTSDYIMKTKVEPNGQMVLVSATDRLENMTGYTVDELRSQSSWSKIVHPDDFDKFQDFWKRILSSRKSCELEFRGIDRKQQFEWLHAYGQPILDEKNDRVISIVFTAKDITERKKAEEALQQSEERLKILFESAPDAIYLIDLKGNFVDGNKTAEEIVGYTREELIGKNFVESGLLSQEQVPKAIASLEKNAMGEPTGPDEFTLTRKDGSCITVEIRTFPVRIENQTLVLGISRDISARKKAEERILREKRFSEGLINSSVDGILAYDSECRYTIWNPGMERISGISKEETLGKCAFNVFPFLKETGEDKFFFEALTGKTVIAKNRSYKIPETGKQGFFEGYYSPLRNVEGDIIGGLAIIRDITERKKAEEALHESEQKYRTLVESAGEFIATINEDGVFLFINRTGAERFGGKPEDYMGKTMWDVFPKKIADRQAAGVRKVIHTGKERNVVALTELQGQLRWCNITIEPLRDDSGKVVAAMVIARDIHELKQAEEELNKYREQMAQAEQLASVGTLSASLAHELTQPLTVIRLSIQNSLAELEKTSCPDTVVEDLKEGLSEVSSIASIVNRFRNFARRTSEIKVAEVDLKAIAERTVKLLDENAWRAKVTLQVEGMDKLPPIYSHEKDLERLFFSLIENAIQAADGKKSRQVIISSVVKDEHIELQLSDNCGGIAPENLDKIFEPFFTTKPAGERTGLGLCVVERIVSQHGGKVRVESKVGKGSTFFVTLPIKGDER